MLQFIIRMIAVLLVALIPLRAIGRGEKPMQPVGADGRPSSPSEPLLPEEPGSFARLFHERKLVAPGLLFPSAAEDAETAAPYRLPADFEPVEAILLVGDRLGREHPDVLRGIAANVAPQACLWMLVADDQGRAAVERLLAPVPPAGDPLRFIESPTDTIWARDFGPVFVMGSDGTRVAVDLEYSLRNRAKDNAVAAIVAHKTNTPIVRPPFLLEGGNLLSNGQGLCVVTTLALNRNIRRGYEPATVVDGLRKSFGLKQLVVLEPLWGESTGHVDMFACFTAADTIVVGTCSKSQDPTSAAILDRNAALLAKVRLDTGPLRVVRVPMPTHEDGVWRTYTNGIFANRLYLMPTYAGEEAAVQAAAIEVFEKRLPGRAVVGLEVGSLIKEGGALRCISVPVPK